MKRWVKHPLFWVISVFLVIALVITGFIVANFASNTEAANDKPLGAGVTVSGRKVPKNLKADTNTDLPEGNDIKNFLKLVGDSKAVKPLTPVIEITPGGELPAPIMLTFKVNRKLKPDATAYVLSQDKPGSPWQWQQAVVAADGQHITIQRTHLSSFWGFVTDAFDLFKSLGRSVIDAVLGDLSAEATPPKCQNEKAARNDNYKIDSSHKKTVYWCFGVENNKRIVRVTSRVKYPLLVKHKGYKVIEKSAYKIELASIGRELAGKNRVVLLPLDTVTFEVPKLDYDEGVKLTTKYDGLTQSLHRMEVGLMALATIITKMDGETVVPVGKSVKERWELISNILDHKDCSNAVTEGNFGKIITSCLKLEYFVKQFTWALLLEPFIFSGQMLNWIAGELQGIWDNITRNAEYTIVVARTNPTEAFVGSWWVHGMQITFRSNGTGQEASNGGECIMFSGGGGCTIYGDFKWWVDGNNLHYKITAVRIISDVTGQPSEYEGDPGVHVGQEIVYRRVNDNLLKLVEVPQGYGNPNLCRVGSEDGGLCGA